MREIKFRAWDVENRTWTFVTLGDLVCGACLSSGDKPLSGAPQIWEQYTGLKDKNGKEIYEGDIVKIRSDKMSELALGGSQYRLEHYPYTREVKIDSRGVYIEYPGYMLLRNFADFEVIGNIHKNPELLEGEK